MENKSVLVDTGNLMSPCKPYSDSTLKNMRKDDLIEYIRTLEKNHDVAVAFNAQQAKNMKDWGPKPRWIAAEARLPRNDYMDTLKRKQYLVFVEPSKTYRVAWFGYKEYDWWVDSHNCVLTKENHQFVTHWIPLFQEV